MKFDKLKEDIIKSLKSNKKEIDLILSKKEGIKKEICFSKSISGLNYTELKRFIIDNNIPENAIIVAGEKAKFQWYFERPMTKEELRIEAVLKANDLIYSKLKELLIKRNIKTTPYIFSSEAMVYLYEGGKYKEIAKGYEVYYEKILSF